MTPLETILEAEFEDYVTKIAELEAKITELEAELADRPVVFAIQQIKTKKLVKKFGEIMLFQTKEDAERYIPTGFIDPFEWHAVVYKGEARWFDNGISNDGWKSLTANGRTTNDTA